jgi:hypothetical protein
MIVERLRHAGLQLAAIRFFAVAAHVTLVRFDPVAPGPLPLIFARVKLQLSFLLRIADVDVPLQESKSLHLIPVSFTHREFCSTP